MAGKPALTLHRRIKAPPEKVYEAWTDPALIARWWGPPGATFLSAEIEPRVGGRFAVGMRTPDGERHDVGGEYRELVPGRKLVFTWAWRTTPERQSLVTLTLAAAGEDTELTLLHENFFDEPARDNHQRGWTGALDKLVAQFE